MTTSSSKYIQIIENIHQELMICEFSDNIGLHSGTSGIALFIAYYDRVIRQNNEVNQKVIDILEHNSRQIDFGQTQHTICNGISGFGWLCEHLRRLGMLVREDIEFLDDLDSFLYKQMMIDIRSGNYDFLHGALGVGTYFLSRLDHKEVLLYLTELFTELEKSAILCDNGAVKWISVIDSETGKKGYNISLSHGMSSIAAFLIRLHYLNFETETVDRLLTGTVTYILDQNTYTDGSLSHFPSLSIDSSNGDNYSRLGWCYGDLGIAVILRKASIALKNDKWERMAIEILRHSSNRRDLSKNAVHDAGLCHGSAGIAYIFTNMYLNTKIKEFKAAADYWLNVSTQLAKHKDGFAGFKAWRREEFGGPQKSYFFLDGIAGIGLALLSQQNIDENAWNECLLLS